MSKLPSKLAFCAFTGGSFSQAFIVDVDGSKLLKVSFPNADSDGHVSHPRWNSTGDRVKFTVSQFQGGQYKDNFFDFDLKSQAAVSCENYAQNPDLENSKSPDGKLAALLQDDENQTGFAIREISSDIGVLYADALEGVSNFLWSPDSLQILVLASNEEGRDNIWHVDVKSKEVSLIAVNVPSEPVWSWAPDSKRLVAVAEDTTGERGWCFYHKFSAQDSSTALFTQEDSTFELLPSTPAWSADSAYLGLAGNASETEDDFVIQLYDCDSKLVKTLRWPDAKLTVITDLTFAPN